MANLFKIYSERNRISDKIRDSESTFLKRPFREERPTNARFDFRSYSEIYDSGSENSFGKINTNIGACSLIFWNNVFLYR